VPLSMYNSHKINQKYHANTDNEMTFHYIVTVIRLSDHDRNYILLKDMLCDTNYILLFLILVNRMRPKSTPTRRQRQLSTAISFLTTTTSSACHLKLHLHLTNTDPSHQLGPSIMYTCERNFKHRVCCHDL
jgi:hypothetical protein